MFKSILLALSLVAVATPSAFAQFESSNTGTEDGRYSYKTGSARAYSAGRGYELEKPGDTGPQQWEEQGWGDTTKTNGAQSGRNPYGPPLRGANSNSSGIPLPGFSGAATGAPVLGTKWAPSNLALQTQYGPAGALFRRLPKTELDSFVYKAAKKGQAWMIYGDEGTYDKPPLDDFHYIIQGVEDPDNLSTGHKSKAPTAWGTPEKYNSPNNSPIYGYNGW